MGCISAFGGSPSAISIAVIPRLHISALLLYPLPWMTSGDIQSGVLQEKKRSGEKRSREREKGRKKGEGRGRNLFRSPTMTYPMIVLRLAIVEVSCSETPKSASLASPNSVRRMFAALMSR